MLAQEILNKNLALVSPDAGAEKKTRDIAMRLSTIEKKLDVFYATKIRDTLTGNITSTDIQGDLNGRNLIIVDDICDGGQTFIELAKVLKNRGAEDVYLYVTHGIFSRGLAVLKNHFKKIFCYYTFLNQVEDKTFLTILGDK
jgi:ribose-phosphate pyrophosphokinase